MKVSPRFLLIEAMVWADVGRALAEQVKTRIRSAPGGRWQKTGRLLSSIESIDKRNGQLVVATGERLKSDVGSQLFADEILTDALDPNVQKAIADAVFSAFVTNGAK